MKRKLIEYFFAATLITTQAYTQPGVPMLENRSKKGILAYLKIVIENEQVIVGQQCSETTNVAANYQKAVQRLYDATGKYPALLGLDYGYFANVDYLGTNRLALEYWKKGGLVTINWSADNPWKPGYDCRWNPVVNKDSIDLKKLLKSAPESKEKSNYRAELFEIATALKQLQQAGVVVLWRPFHEVNGDWFWWGINDKKSPTNMESFTALWKDLYETLTIDFELDNLLWVFTPNAHNDWVAPIVVMYPGGKYVDIVGTDIYTRKPAFSDYNELDKLRRLVVNGEVGPAKESFGKYNQLEVLNMFKGKAAYFLQWHSWTNANVAIVDNINCKEMMHHEAAITLDKISGH